MMCKLKCEHLIISSGWGLAFFLDIVITWAHRYKLEICAPPKKKHCQHARKIRSDEKFNLFWKDVENKAAIFDVDLPRLPERQLESRNAGKSAAPEFDDDVYLITEKYTTSNWIVSSMPSKIDSIWKIHQNIHKIRKSPSQSCKRKRPR